jgi:hypothetical protein
LPGLHVGRFLQGRKLAPLPFSLVKDGCHRSGIRDQTVQLRFERHEHLTGGRQVTFGVQPTAELDQGHPGLVQHFDAVGFAAFPPGGEPAGRGDRRVQRLHGLRIVADGVEGLFQGGGGVGLPGGGTGARRRLIGQLP